MSSKGKNWSWSDEAKQNLSDRKKGVVPKHLVAATTKHGIAKTLEYNSWKKMMGRCYKPNDKSYHLYGARGIKVTERWHDPQNFYDDMVGRWGNRPKGYSLERVDVNGDYCLENCCWIPLGWQAKNRRPWQHTPEGLNSIREARRKSKEK